MIYVYAALVVLVGILVGLNLKRFGHMNDARRRGKLPPKGKATMFDVRHLLMEGEKDLAIDVYCEIFNVPAAKAKKEVEELQRSLKV